MTSQNINLPPAVNEIRPNEGNEISKTCFLLADCRIYLGDFNRKHYITVVDSTEVFSWFIREVINISLSVCTKKQCV